MLMNPTHVAGLKPITADDEMSHTLVANWLWSNSIPLGCSLSYYYPCVRHFNTEGTFGGHRYFTCAPGHAVLTSFSKVTLLQQEAEQPEKSSSGGANAETNPTQSRGGSGEGGEGGHPNTSTTPPPTDVAEGMQKSAPGPPLPPRNSNVASTGGSIVARRVKLTLTSHIAFKRACAHCSSAHAS